MAAVEMTILPWERGRPLRYLLPDGKVVAPWPYLYCDCEQSRGALAPHGPGCARTFRPTIPLALRTAVMDRDGLTCGICRAPVKVRDVHLDHIVSVANGGPTTLDNLRVAHSWCNLRKGSR